MRTEDLPPWAGRFRRQLHALPQGEEALVRLLAAVDGLLVKAQHCGPHSAVLRAYITLGTIDLVAQAWQQRTAELRKVCWYVALGLCACGWAAGAALSVGSGTSACARTSSSSKQRAVAVAQQPWACCRDVRPLHTRAAQLCVSIACKTAGASRVLGVP